jgi:protein-S-isoprenylcysteine O-methyltransferase
MDDDQTRSLRPRASARSASDGPSALETIPTDEANQFKGEWIPNTPLGASTTSFILGTTFAFGLVLFFWPLGLLGSPSTGDGEWLKRWSYFGFFIAGWAGFHWGEYAVAAGWNRARCSVDCAYAFELMHTHSRAGAKVASPYPILTLSI